MKYFSLTLEFEDETKQFRQTTELHPFYKDHIELDYKFCKFISGHGLALNFIVETVSQNNWQIPTREIEPTYNRELRRREEQRQRDLARARSEQDRPIQRNERRRYGILTDLIRER